MSVTLADLIDRHLAAEAALEEAQARLAESRDALRRAFAALEVVEHRDRHYFWGDHIGGLAWADDPCRQPSPVPRACDVIVEEIGGGT